MIKIFQTNIFFLCLFLFLFGCGGQEAKEDQTSAVSQVEDSATLIKLAVSLGSTESLAEHPATMTHVDIEAEVRLRLSITDKLVRLSVGVENFKDIIWDVEQALDTI